MDLRQLRYFVAVAEELHFRRAAARLHISQPPLSQQIAALEAELGVRLLERTRRRVELTSAGDAFLRDARATLAELDAAVSTARAIGSGQAGVLRVSFVGSALLSIVPAAVQRFRPPPAPGYPAQLIGRLAATGTTPHVVQYAPEMTTIIGLVAAGIGVSPVPASVAHLALDGVTYRPLAGAPDTELVALTRAGEASPLAEAFVDDARAVA